MIYFRTFRRKFDGFLIENNMRYTRINTEHVHKQRFAIKKNTKEQNSFNEPRTFDKQCQLETSIIHIFSCSDLLQK
jgi:hypothetical protein